MASELSSSRSAGGSGSSSPATTAARPRTISSRPAPPASTTPASRRTSSCSGVRARAFSPRRTSAARNAGTSASMGRASVSSASSRMTDSIVPSTGSRTARYAASRAPWNVRPTTGASILDSSPRTSAAPRTICERITPELPRAPISAARVTSLTSAGRSVAVERSSAVVAARASFRTCSRSLMPTTPSPAARSRGANHVSPASPLPFPLVGSCRRPPDVLDPHLDVGDIQTGQPLDLVADAIAEHRGDLGEIEAVFHYDAELDGHSLLGAATDSDPLAQAVAREQPLARGARGHPDDAVGLCGDATDDVGHRLVRNRNPPEGRRQRGSRLHVRIRPRHPAPSCGSPRRPQYQKPGSDPGFAGSVTFSPHARGAAWLRAGGGQIAFWTFPPLRQRVQT